jgi:hypothetical protein
VGRTKVSSIIYYFWREYAPMKNKIIICFLPMFFTLSAVAQQFNGGVMLGGAATTVAGDRYGGFNKAGLYGGAFVNLSVGEFSYLQLELAFFQKGARNKENPDVPDLNQYLLRLNYVELPLVYQYRIAHIRFEAGVSFDFLMHHYEEVNYQPIETDVWKGMTLNSIFGVKYDLSERTTLSLRTVNSINSIRKNQVEGNVRRYSRKHYGAFNDAFLLSFYFSL